MVHPRKKTSKDISKKKIFYKCRKQFMKAKLGPQDISCFPPALFIWLWANMDKGQSKNTHHNHFLHMNPDKPTFHNIIL